MRRILVNSSTLNRLLRTIVFILIPFMLTLVTLRVLVSWNAPSYPEFEYGRIESDRFGFSDDDRLQLANATLGYLRDPRPADEAIILLEELRIPGSDDPLYNDREIGHMIDVKKLVDTFNVLMWVLVALVVIDLGYLLIRSDARREGYRAIYQGGILTVGILLVMLVLIVAAWSLVFTQFHELLFPPDTWTFYYSDSLIRLFPEQFWFDFGLLWTGAIFVEGLILTLAGYLLIRRGR
jgi:integral membrane protein (TIGR01906 family)